MTLFFGRSRSPIRSWRDRGRIEVLENRIAPAATFSQFADPHPSSGNQFGDSVLALSTGHVVITAPMDDTGGSNVGAVYVFNGATGALISELHGSTANDHVGSGGVFAVGHGNFVVLSQDWGNGSQILAGAATWGSGTTGVAGTVGAANSLVGTQANDQVGNTGVTILSNGNYVVSSYSWANATVSGAGAASWGDGDSGVKGAVSASNSLVGSRSGDYVGIDGITPLTNGGYVVLSSSWHTDGVTRAGAATWGSPSGGVSGAISSANSLIGNVDNDFSSNNGVLALSNGNYVVRTPHWHNFVGAATWGSGTTGTFGVVSSAISLVGSSADDNVGANGIALTNGNYVIISSNWKNGTADDAGAVTWGSGTAGVKGVISASNSLVGTTAFDSVGAAGVTPLTNGNYVVINNTWQKAANLSVGAVTWGNGTTGIVGAVSASNSLIGSVNADRVGYGGVIALSNGNYVVNSIQWNNGTATKAGAVTWANGATGLIGTVSASNSLIGSAINDQVGLDGVVPLSNGNYVVRSSTWNGAVADVGAVTWGSGTSGVKGTISASNSLVGSRASDLVGDTGVTALSNGNYVVRSSNWDNGSLANAGAVTWGSGTSGIFGAVSASNSLVGSSASDQAGSGAVTELANGHYVVSSPNWKNGTVTLAGAVTWGSGTSGVAGMISAANSLIGSTANDQLSTVVPLTNGNYVVRAPFWDNVGVLDAGAVTWGSGTSGAIGTISAGNSLVGTTVSDQVGAAVTALSTGNYAVVSPKWHNAALANAGAATFGNGVTGTGGAVSSGNSAVGLSANAGLGGVVVDDVNHDVFARFQTESGGGKVRVGSQTSGFTPDLKVELLAATSVTEGVAGTLVYTFTRTGGTTSPLTVAFTKTGAAVLTADFTATSSGTLNYAAGTVVIPAGQSTATVTLTPVNDRNVEGNETVTLTLGAGAYAIIGSPATGTIVDNDTATIGFLNTTSSVGEAAGADAVKVVLTLAGTGTGTPTLERDVTFNLVTAAGGTATAGADYTLPGLLTFTAGALSGDQKTCNLAIVDDRTVEGGESANLGLAIGTDNTGGQATVATGTASHATSIMENDQATLGFQLSTSTALESAGSISLGVTLSIDATGAGPIGLASDISANLAVAGGTAAAADYSFSVASVTFAAGAYPAGTADANFAVIVNDDQVVEGAETVQFALTSGSFDAPVLRGLTAHAVTITDNDTASLAFVTGTSAIGEAVGAHAIGVQLVITGNGIIGTGTLGQAVSVNVQQLLAGTATSGDDYALTAPATFAAGSSSATQNVTLTLNDDTVVEGSESAEFALSDLVDATGQLTLGTSTHVLTIADNDTATVSLVNGTSAIGEAAGAHAVGVQLVIIGNGVAGVGTLGNAVSVDVQDLATGTATSGSDYAFASPATLTFAAGTAGMTKVATLTLTNDASVEGAETVNLTLNGLTDSTGQAALGSITAHTVTIADDDAATIGFSAAASTVGEGGASDAVGLTLTISPGAGSTGPAKLERNVSFNVIAAAGGSAESADYTLPGVLTFTAGGALTQIATVAIFNDALVEGTESIHLSLSAGTDGTGGRVTLAAAGHAVAITDDDFGAIRFAQVDNSYSEGSAVNGLELSFIVLPGSGSTGPAALARDLSVRVTSTGAGVAVSGVDYTLPGVVTIPAGTLQYGIIQTRLDTINDALVEGTEWGELGLAIDADGTGGQVALGTGTGTDAVHAISIGDDDYATVGFSSASSTADEGGGPALLGFTLTLMPGAGSLGPAALARATTFHVITTSGTTVDGFDYTFPTTVTFPVGSGPTQTTHLAIIDDATVEGTEIAGLTLEIEAGSGGGQITVASGAANHAVTIIDNDTALVILTGGLALAEGNSGGTAYQFTATLDHAVQGGFTVSYATSDGTATVADHDYAAQGGTLTFAGHAGETKTFTVFATGDTNYENDESFTVALGVLTGAPAAVSVNTTPQTGILTNDDAPPVISIDDVRMTEGNPGGTFSLATFTVSLSNASLLPVSVAFATADATATAPGDYSPVKGTLTFAPGETSKTISVGIRPDTLFEGGDETFAVELSNATGATLGDMQGIGTISSDDGMPAYTIPLDAKQPITFFDHNHDKVTVRLSGLGTGTLILDGGVLDNADISEIKLADNAAKSTLSIAVVKDRSRGDGVVNVGEVTVNGGLASFSGPAVDFTVGGLRAAGAVKTINAHSLFAGEIFTGGATTDKLALTFGGALGYGDPILLKTPENISALKAARIGAGEIHAEALGSITTTAGGFAADVTSVGAIGRITVKGGTLSGDLSARNFGAFSTTGIFAGSITSTASAATLGRTKALTSLSIASGNLTGSVNADGAVGAITLKSGAFLGELTAGSFGAVSVTGGNFGGTLVATTPLATLGATKALASLRVVSGDLSGLVRVTGAAGPITVKGAISGELDAASFGAVSVTGNFSGQLVSLTPAATLGRIKALTSFTITDGHLTGDIRLLGASGAITVKAKPGADAGDLSGASIVASAIASLTVGRDFISSIVVAGADLGADYAFGGAADTFAAGTIGAVKIGHNAGGAGSIIGAGFSTADTHLKDVNDAIIGGVASSIASLTVTGTADPGSYFAAGLFKTAPKIAGGVATPAGDGRFLVG